MLIEGQEVNKISSSENDSHTGLRCAIFFFFLLGVGVRSLRADLSLFNPAFLELRIPLSLPLPPQFWDYRREPPQVCTSPGAFLFLKLLQSVNLFKTKDIDEQRKTAKV